MLAPDQWLNAAEQDGTGIAAQSALTTDEQAQEYLLMSLRLAEGSDLARYEALGGAILAPERINAMQGDGYVSLNGQTLTATARGRILLNSVLAELLR